MDKDVDIWGYAMVRGEAWGVEWVGYGVGWGKMGREGGRDMK